jgi:hypothetical protein
MLYFGQEVGEAGGKNAGFGTLPNLNFDYEGSVSPTMDEWR